MTSSNIETVAPKALSQRLANEFLNTQSHFAIPGDIKDQTTGTPLNPGLADIQLAKIEQIGHRDKFPRPYDWENLVPLLLPGEELLWIIEKRGQDFSIYLGLKKNERQIDGVHVVRERRKHFEVLCNHFARRSFPESHIILLEPEHVLFFLKKTYTDYNDGVTCVTGIPSPKAINEETIYEERDEQTRPFASLNDVLEPLIEEDQFTIVFCVGRANGLQVLEKLQAKAELRNDIAPLIKQEVNISKTDTNEHHEEQTGGIVDGTSSQDSPNIVKKLLQFLTGADERGWGRRPALGKQHSTNTGWSKGESHSTTVDTGMGFTAFNATLDFIDKALELSMRHLQQAMGAGGFFGSSMIYAAEEQSRNRIARSMCATLAGSHSYLRPMQGLPFNGPNATFHLRSNWAVHEVMDELGVDVEILNPEQAGRLLLLPEAELPGMKLKKNVFYGRPSVEQKKGIKLGDMAFFQKTITDQLKQPDLKAEEDHSFYLAENNDLCSHVLIVGTTGSGKTERAVSILNKLDSKKFQIIVLETAKKTYRDKLRRGDEKPHIYTLGVSSQRPFRINPFYFDPGTSLKRHVSILSDAMSELLPVEALIGPKLREAIERCYAECGWNIETDTYTGKGFTRYPDMILFNSEVYKICSTFEDYGPEVKGNYKGALLNRARIFIDDLYQDIFAFDGNKTFSELFPGDTIIEMEEMPPSEIHMPAFIMSLVIERLRAHCVKQAANNDKSQSRQIVLVIEEAHNILHRRFEENRGEREAGRGRRLIEQVVRLLQEGRGIGLGMMIVDQSARYLADAVITNTNTKIVHRQEHGEEVKTLGEALGLPEDDWDDLKTMADGECIVKTKSLSRPIKLSPIPDSDIKSWKWNPFDGSMVFCPPYHMAEADFDDVKDCNTFDLETLRICSDSILETYRYNYGLIRYVLGRYWIFKGTANDYKMAEKVSGVRTRRELESILWQMTPEPAEAYCSFLRLLIDALAFSELQPVSIPDFIKEKKTKYGVNWGVDQTHVFLNRLRALQKRMSTGSGGEVSFYDRKWLKSVESQLIQWSEKVSNAVDNDIAKEMARVQWVKYNTRRYESVFLPLLFMECGRVMNLTPLEIRLHLKERYLHQTIQSLEEKL